MSTTVPDLGVVPEVPEPPLSIWGALVAARRGDLGLAQRHLGDAVGVTQQGVSKIERGTVCTTDSLKLRLAFALGCQAHDLFPMPVILRP